MTIKKRIFSYLDHVDTLKKEEAIFEELYVAISLKTEANRKTEIQTDRHWDIPKCRPWLHLCGCTAGDFFFFFMCVCFSTVLSFISFVTRRIIKVFFKFFLLLLLEISFIQSILHLSRECSMLC